MKKFFKIGCLSIIVLAVVFYLIGDNMSDNSDYEISDTLKFQNPELKSKLIQSEKRENAEFEFMATSIINTTIYVSGDDKEEEARLARCINNDLGIKGNYNITTTQNFDLKNLAQIPLISMTTRYKGFDYVLDYYNTDYENVYKINIESGKNFVVNSIK